ncbi:unnamed protein product, partial [Rotaria sordida]
LDALNSRKVHQLLSSQKNTVKFLQDLKLLSQIPNEKEQCSEFDNHDWDFAKLNHLTDGYTFRCRRCLATRSLGTSTFFELSHLP